MIYDAIVVGAGPAGLSIAAELCRLGLRLLGVSPKQPETPWANTYGIWCDDLEILGLGDLLAHRWSDCSVYTNSGEIPLKREYGLFDNGCLQTHLLAQCGSGSMVWQTGSAARVNPCAGGQLLVTQDGKEFTARIVIDASGHRPALIRRTPGSQLAYQAAYGIVGTFRHPPVRQGQMVLMDYRADHLSEIDRDPPTFLYAMDLGKGTFFVEETSLACRPAFKLKTLENRLSRRLESMGTPVTEIQRVEKVIFPMDSPLPGLPRPVVGFGGAASMVHPASGYMVGAVLKRAPLLAGAIAQALAAQKPDPVGEAWRAVWPIKQVRKRALYLFGLENIMRLNSSQVNQFFQAFFNLPERLWRGYLSDTLSIGEILQAMLRMFYNSPGEVKLSLAQSIGQHGHWINKAIHG
jgi:lycopene beta-cyclase